MKCGRSKSQTFHAALRVLTFVISLMAIRRGADEFLARPTSRCRRTESIVSLERGLCSCADLQVFSSYRGWKEACKATRAISTTSRRELSSRFFPARQGAEGNSRHSERNIRGTCTVKNWVAQFKRGDFFHLWCASSWTTENSDHPGGYWSNSRTNLVRRPDFG